MLRRFARLFGRRAGASVAVPAQEPVAAAPPAPAPRFDEDLAAAGTTPAAWCRQRRASRTLHSGLSDAELAVLRERFPARVQATVNAAGRVLRHEFEMLGSGPFVAADPDRAARDGYRPIDWYLDPVRRLRFPRGVHYRKWNLYEMRPANADIKYPWELGRCQHWAPLGQAFGLTRDDRFAVEIARQLDDFVEANPVGVGVNWTCTMDVAIRAANWAIALEMARLSPALDDAFWQRAYSALFDHGAFIRDNLENTYEVTSNHFLSNIVGLQFVAAVFADLPHGRAWDAFARESIEHEMIVQVLQDGADYESSIPYHRLVAELFLGASRLADYQGSPLSNPYNARLRLMIEYLAAVTRPDGLMPQVGDADDGRLHVFGGYGTATPQDGRHLLGPAAAMFGEATWRGLAGEAGEWEAAWWGLDAGKPLRPGDGASVARLFPQAGVAVAKTGDRHYLLVSNGVVGTNGFGNHKHNDQLSFEYHHGGTPLVVDPGSYVYTSDPDARNRFRGTASHNTVSVDGVEQNELRPEWLFRLFETSHAEHVSFDDGAGAVEYVGRHRGYERLADPVLHERTVRLLKPSGALVVVDRLTGSGEHDLRWHFHLAPGVEATQLDSRTVSLAAGGARWRLCLPPGLAVAIGTAAYSPSYGVAVPCAAIDLSLRTSLGAGPSFEFSITP